MHRLYPQQAVPKMPSLTKKREKMTIASLHLYKRNIFPARKSLVSDIPAGEGKTAKPFFTVYISSGIKDFDSAIVFILHQKSHP